MEKNRDNRLVIIVKIEKYIEYMLTILLKLPRIEKFSIGTEAKTSMYEIMKMKNWKNSTWKNFLQVQTEGNRQVKRNIDHYNLDMIIALGYRVQSQVATRFRVWTTQRLYEYMQHQ